jgi:dihydropteroate synthase
MKQRVSHAPLVKPLLRRPLVFGILNITPDSFSDGGVYFDPTLAESRITELFDLGADIVDIGAESTRPGAIAISPKEEWSRLEPILQSLSKKDFPWHRLSLDSRHPETILNAARFNIDWYNTVGYKPTKELLAELKQIKREPKFIVTHMHLNPLTMQQNPLNGDRVVDAVTDFFDECAEVFENSGWPSGQRFFDPGIGFGKDDSANWTLIRHLDSFQTSYQNLMVGLSRKALIKRTFNLDSSACLDTISKSIELMLGFTGSVAAIRTHDVRGLIYAFTHTRQFAK